MIQIDIVSTLVQVVGALFAILILVLGWIGARIHNRLDEINKTLGAIERDLRSELSSLDRRVTKMEAHVETCPGNQQ